MICVGNLVTALHHRGGPVTSRAVLYSWRWNKKKSHLRSSPNVAIPLPGYKQKLYLNALGMCLPPLVGLQPRGTRLCPCMIWRAMELEGYTSPKHIETETKWPIFCRRRFWIQVLVQTLFYYCSNLTDVFANGPINSLRPSDAYMRQQNDHNWLR